MANRARPGRRPKWRPRLRRLSVPAAFFLLLVLGAVALAGEATGQVAGAGGEIGAREHIALAVAQRALNQSGAINHQIAEIRRKQVDESETVHIEIEERVDLAFRIAEVGEHLTRAGDRPNRSGRETHSIDY